jgi:hypothetical protein
VRRASVAVALALAVGGAILGSALPVDATHTSQTDPRDARGPLDVRTVDFVHTGRPTWRFVTFGRWTPRAIWDLGFLVVELDTRGDQAIDRMLVIRSDGARLVGTLFAVRRDGGQAALGSVRVDKDGARRASVRVGLAKLAIGSARTVYPGPPRRSSMVRDVCDRAWIGCPIRGWSSSRFRPPHRRPRRR